MKKTSLLCCMLLLLCPPLLAADGSGWATFTSREGTVVYLAMGTALPLMEDGSAGGRHALRTADTLATTAFVCDGLKHLIHETRPDGSNAKSFPSMHAATAFSVAAMESKFHPDQATWWYLGASLIAASRVQLDKHYVHDVLAGAAIGYIIARVELHQPRGLILYPIMPESMNNRLLPVSMPPTLVLAPWLSEEGLGLQARCPF